MNSHRGTLHDPWWKGTRGEWLVVIQFALMGLVFFGPTRVGGWPQRPFPFPALAAYAGAALIVIGGAVFTAGASALGDNLTPLPHPKRDATLVQTGAYRFVRHPIYSGGILLAFGWALLRQGWLTVGYALVLLIFLDIKSRSEERRLEQEFPEYGDYRRRVRKLVPFLY
ncbi:MAG: isoprenylcysteine carboxylmethyltransferase family protein [Acidobacteria bacterium]|nr:isoprenylcysteine carboxylmethyltransferase family protein [Acidobacteriota bacterium]